MLLRWILTKKGAREMAYRPQKPNNAYKKGKLSHSDRFSRKKTTNWTLVAVISCVVLTFIFAMILGNYLGKKAEDSKNTTTNAGGASSLTPPEVDKVAPQTNLHAYFADLRGVDPGISPSEQTGEARKRGNALYFELRDENGNLVYSSEGTEELGYPARENLTLSRLNNHLDYYADFAVGHFNSDFSYSLGVAERLSVKAQEITLLAEATDDVLSQIIVSFESEFTKANIVHYQSYLLDLKLACKGVPIGVELDYNFIVDADNSGMIADLLAIADFYTLDLSSRDVDSLESALAPLVYFTERYNGVIMISLEDENTLAERLEMLANKSVESYIVK